LKNRGEEKQKHGIKKVESEGLSGAPDPSGGNSGSVPLWARKLLAAATGREKYIYALIEGDGGRQKSGRQKEPADEKREKFRLSDPVSVRGAGNGRSKKRAAYPESPSSPQMRRANGLPKARRGTAV